MNTGNVSMADQHFAARGKEQGDSFFKTGIGEVSPIASEGYRQP